MTEAVVSSHMDPAVKLLWLDALRSGEFNQGTGRLVVLNDDGEPEGFCCLGVLCELAVREGVIQPGEKADEYDHLLSDPDRNEDSADRLVYGSYSGRFDDTSSTELPNVVREWAGLGQATPEVEVPRDPEDIEYDRDFGVPEEDIRLTTERSVAELNDDAEWDFDQIADAIEKSL